MSTEFWRDLLTRLWSNLKLWCPHPHIYLHNSATCIGTFTSRPPACQLVHALITQQNKIMAAPPLFVLCEYRSCTPNTIPPIFCAFITPFGGFLFLFLFLPTYPTVIQWHLWTHTSSACGSQQGSCRSTYCLLSTLCFIDPREQQIMRNKCIYFTFFL